MNSPKRQRDSFLHLWLIIGIGTGIILGVIFAGNVLIIGTRLRAIYPVLEWGFYGAIGLFFCWVSYTLVFAVFCAPVVALEDIADKSDIRESKTLKKVARMLATSASLPPASRDKLHHALVAGTSLREPLTEVIHAQKQSAVLIIREHAVVVFVSTAISQNGRFDALSVLVTNSRLIRRLVDHFGYRPPTIELVKIYVQIILAAIVADRISDLDFEGVLSQLGLGFLDAVPGSRLILDSAFDGTFNALVTLRIGFVTQRCLLNAGKPLLRSEVRKIANQEARAEFKNVILEAVPQVPEALQKILQRWL